MITYEMGVAHGTAVGHFLPGYVKNASYEEQQFLYENANFKNYDEFADFIEKTCVVDIISDALMERTVQSVVSNAAKKAACPFYFNDTILKNMEGKKENMKKGVIFDLDGTLWDSSQAVVDSWNEAIRKFTDEKYYCTLEMMHNFMGRTMEEIGIELFCNETRERAMELLTICMDYENQYIEKTGGILFDGLEEMLQELKQRGYFIAIVSNCQEGYIEAFLKYHKLGKYFNDTENYGRTGRDKDYNIKLVVERNKLDKAVYVGDIMGDYNSTMKAGLPFIHAAYGFGTVPEGTPRVESIREIPDKVVEIIG